MQQERNGRKMTGLVLHLLQSAGKVTLFLAASLTSAVSAIGQISAPVPPTAIANSPAYEVISIKPSKPANGWQIGPRADGFFARNVTLWGLIYNAYNVRPVDPVSGLPKWADSEQFDVEAKMDEATYVAFQKFSGQQRDEQHRLMLRSLLADRFKLRIHHEARERPIYALVIARGRCKLKEPPSSKAGGWVRRGEIHYLASPVSVLVFSLSNIDDVGRAVVDQTGLAGEYDINLKWAPDDTQGTPDAGPSIFTALEEQLGLKLVATKGPVDTIVVDNVEQPSEN
jgi:uncharacterized protein (TIGR03435 family)